MRRGTRFLSSILVVAGIGGFWASSAEADVVLNEVNCAGTDWVEIVNTSGVPADISGWLLTDDPLNPATPRPDHRMLFADPTVIDPNSDLVVSNGAGGFPFGISCNDTVRLADATETLVDETAIAEHTVSTDTWGRYPNGVGPFLQTLPTEGAPNQPSTGGGGPDPDLAAWMFDPAAVVEVDLELPRESIEELEEEPEEYQDGAFSLATIGGSYGPLQVGVRLKGQGSFRTLDAKAAFKIKFSHSVPGQRFLGLKSLTLNNMIQDASMIHEVLAHELFRSVGVAAPRTGYAYVRVNDQDYGVYLNIETPDEVSLGRWFDTTRHLFEGGYAVDVSPGGAGDFEVDEGSESDLSDLEALIAAANTTGGDWSDQIDGVLDLDQATRMWAVEHYAGHWDGYSPDRAGSTKPNNYFLHSEASGRFAMLPWGTDLTWIEHVPFDDPAGILFRRCLEDESCAALYESAVREVRTAAIGLDLDGRAVATAALLAPWQQLDPRREHSLAQIEAAVLGTRSFLADRPLEVDGWLGLRGEVAGGFDPQVVSSPETTITKRPKGVVHGRQVKFRFRSSEPGSGFECRLDGNRFAPCASPATIRVGAGRHTFRVRAQEGGQIDPTPAVATFAAVPAG